ncbi:MAG: LLM class flavin-dependent oxidoreductase [bacterium]
MDFSIQLSAYYASHEVGGRRLYGDMLAQAELADRLGFAAVSITEHHLINILLMPAPLQFAVKIACATERVEIMTSVLVLPLHDMRILAGQLVCADIFTDGRLMAGVGRGAFAYEMERLGVPMTESRERFDESLAVLQTLLREEEVSWRGKYYRFEPLTIMPRPDGDGPPIMLSALAPEAIYHCAKRGFHVQTTPLAGDDAHMRAQVDAFHRGKAESGARGAATTLSLSRVAFVAENDADRRAKIEIAHRYYGQFDNVFSGAGIVERGLIAPTMRRASLAETARNLHICTAAEMIDQLAPYAQVGVDRFILNINFGADQAETLDAIQRFAEEVMPHFTDDDADATARG